jgi:hypothetical protein
MQQVEQITQENYGAGMLVGGLGRKGYYRARKMMNQYSLLT